MNAFLKNKVKMISAGRVIPGLMLLAFLFWPEYSFAATLRLASEGENRAVGEVYTVEALVDTDGVSVNAATGTIKYDKSRLTLRSVSTADSSIAFWIVPPVDNLGEIHFEGVMLGTSIKNNTGKLFSIIFETKSVGDARVYFLDGSVLKNDGKATNILEKFINESVVIKTGRARVPVVVNESEIQPTIALIEEDSMVDDYKLAIIEYPTRVLPNERVVLKGVAGANDEVSVNLAIGRSQSIGERFLRVLKNSPATLTATVETDSSGEFSHVFNESLVAGVYSAWAEKASASSGEDGEKLKSSDVFIEIKYGTFYKIWIWLVNTLLLVIPIALLGVIVFTIFWRGKREIASAERFTHRRGIDNDGK